MILGLVDRYGLAEILQWKFEVWNEPNCGYFRDPKIPTCCDIECGPKETYFQLYKTTALAVKSVHSGIKIGLYISLLSCVHEKVGLPLRKLDG